MFNTPGYVSPGPIILTQWYIVPSTITHYVTELAWEGFRAVTGKPRAGDGRAGGGGEQEQEEKGGGGKGGGRGGGKEGIGGRGGRGEGVR